LENFRWLHAFQRYFENNFNKQADLIGDSFYFASDRCRKCDWNVSMIPEIGQREYTGGDKCIAVL
jgi:hypothetical protein